MLHCYFQWLKYKGKYFADCGEYQLKHWLTITRTMMADLQHIHASAVFYFEDFSLGDPQGWCNVTLLSYNMMNCLKYRYSY